MSRTAVPDGNRHAGLLLCLALAGVFAWLLARNLGLNPAIFADEWYYSRMSRLMPLSEAVVPSSIRPMRYRSFRPRDSMRSSSNC